MRPSLALENGVLFAGGLFGRPEVRAFDLDGHALELGWSLRGPTCPRASLDGLAVDADRRVWVADAAAGGLRAFTLFGREIALPSALAARDEYEDRDAPGRLGRPAAIAVDGVEDDLRLLIASKGERRHALQLISAAGDLLLSLRPRGDPEASFRGLTACALRGRMAWAAEGHTGFVQVFRDGDIHFLFAPPTPRGARGHAEPSGLAPLEDGRVVVATGGGDASGLHVFDPGGQLVVTLARAGMAPGEVFEPSDVVLERGVRGDRARIAVVDQDGERIQVFTLAGECYGSFFEEAPMESGGTDA